MPLLTLVLFSISYVVYIFIAKAMEKARMKKEEELRQFPVRQISEQENREMEKNIQDWAEDLERKRKRTQFFGRLMLGVSITLIVSSFGYIILCHSKIITLHESILDLAVKIYTLSWLVLLYAAFELLMNKKKPGDEKD